MDNRPELPRLAHSFFRWYCRRDRYEELHGDLEEIFYEDVHQKGLSSARRNYIWNVIRCCQPYAWRQPDHQPVINTMMYKNYYKTTWRVLQKNPVSSFINIFGLTLAIGFCILSYAFTHWTYSTDDFHEKKNQVYLATYFADMEGTLQQHGMTPRPLGEILRQDFPGIQRVCRIDDKSLVVKRDDKVFHEKIRFVDPTFLEMFTFPLKWGTPESLSDLNTIIISEEVSMKYFGEENPVGQDLLIIFGEDRHKRFEVGGVARRFPSSRSFDFSILVNFDNTRVAFPDYDPADWASTLNATLIEVDDASYVSQIATQMDKYVTLQNAALPDWEITSFVFEPLATLYERSDNIRYSLSKKGFSNNEKSVYFLVGIGLALLILACINYVNIAIVSAAKRLKEIGVRKSIGATSGKVILQFLLENLFLTMFALVFGVALGTYVIVPWFESLNVFQTEFSLLKPSLWIFLAGILLLTGLASGIYPALFISRFQTASIFRRNIQFGKQNPLTKIFLGVQLVLACITITTAVMFTLNSDYLAERPWGYDHKNLLYVSVPASKAAEQLEAALADQRNILSQAAARDHIGKSHKVSVVKLPERKYEVHEFGVSPSYFETMGVDLKQGRVFESQDGADQNAIVVNETFVQNLQWTQPIGQQLEVDSIRYEVIGVVKDFHTYSFSNKVQPTIFTIAAKDEMKFLAINVKAGTELASLNTVQEKWAKLYPEIPFQGGHQEDVWGFYLSFVQVHGKVWRMVATITVILASLGLYGLVMLNVRGRIKEFSIRKVLGASIKSITQLLLKQYTLLFIISLSIGAPLSFLLVKSIMEMAYKYHMPVDLTGTMWACIGLLSVLGAVVITQVRRLANENPVSGLKTE